jgi:chromosome segregation ATPase
MNAATASAMEAGWMECQEYRRRVDLMTAEMSKLQNENASLRLELEQSRQQSAKLQAEAQFLASFHARLIKHEQETGELFSTLFAQVDAMRSRQQNFLNQIQHPPIVTRHIVAAGNFQQQKNAKLAKPAPSSAMQQRKAVYKSRSFLTGGRQQRGRSKE